jgi:hypothetical protein
LAAPSASYNNNDPHTHTHTHKTHKTLPKTHFQKTTNQQQHRNNNRNNRNNPLYSFKYVMGKFLITIFFLGQFYSIINTYLFIFNRWQVFVQFMPPKFVQFILPKFLASFFWEVCLLGGGKKEEKNT